jgi:dipeptidyl aminopeptidase/acylaminoacyl peptidase
MNLTISNKKRTSVSILKKDRGAMDVSILRCVAGACLAVAAAVQAGDNHHFDLKDDIEMVEFTDPYRGLAQVKWAPDFAHFVVVTSRGDVTRNMVEADLWLFAADRVADAIADKRNQSASDHMDVQGFSKILATMNAKSGGNQDPVISGIRWLDDSVDILFIARAIDGRRKLFQVDTQSGTLKALSNPGQDVTAYDVNNSRVAYSVLRPRGVPATDPLKENVAVVGNGKTLGQMVLPPISEASMSDLWVIDDGASKPVLDERGRPIHLQQEPGLPPNFRIAPNGKTIAARLVVPNVPKIWELYRPADDLPMHRIRAGEQDVLDSTNLYEKVEMFSIIDIKSGAKVAADIGPLGSNNGYRSAYVDAAWTSDSRHIVLSNTYLGMSSSHDSKRSTNLLPCIATVDVVDGKSSCVVSLPPDCKEIYASGIHHFGNARFLQNESQAVLVDSVPFGFAKPKATLFRQTKDGNWAPDKSWVATEPAQPRLRVSVKQGLNDPPVLVAEDVTARSSLTIMDPNPGLKNMDLGEASVFEWRDALGRRWVGGLVKPPGLSPNRRYPLVIQTHGFLNSEFMTHGPYTTSFAARELAASGIVVLQLGYPDDDEVRRKNQVTPREGEMQMAGYEAAIDALSSQKLIDTSKIGIIGFSRTVYHVMVVLTKSRFNFAAASTADGVNLGYLQQLTEVDTTGVSGEAITMIGASPVGEGLKRWLLRSPEFNMDKVHTPLRIEAHGPGSLIDAWEPYALLRMLHRPVEIILLNTNEHVTTNPATRVVSQGGSVDWFRFWLQGYEDPDSAKAEQYKRWEGLCEMQVVDNPGRPAYCVRDKH